MTDLTSLKLCSFRRRAAAGCGAAATSRSITAAALTEGWGMTETAPAGTFTPRDGARQAGLVRHSDAAAWT